MATAQNGTVTATTITDANNSTQEPATALGATTAEKRWPGWPGECVFRLIVPMGKVGSIIGRKGELVKKTCEDTRARIRVLDAPLGTPDRVVLITGKEEPEAALSPAMDATIRIFKRISGLSETDSDNKGSAGVVFCSIRLLVASTQAVNLIGKQGSLIKSMQESSGASIRVLSAGVDETQFHAATTDERIVELQGEALKVLKALEAVVSHLRRFLVDHSVLPLFEKPYTAPTTQPHQAETLADKSLHIASQTSIFSDISLPTKRDSVFADRGSLLDSLLPSSTVSVYGQDSSLSAVRSSALTPLSRAAAPIVSTVVQTMQIPLSYAEDIIGVQGTNIEYIRRTSGAILTVQESRVPDEIVVEIKGSSSQVQTAEQLIQEVISNHKDPVASSYGRVDAGLRSSYAAVGETGLGSSYSTVGDTGLRSSYATLGDVGLRNSYSTVGTASRPAPSLTSQPYSGYGASSLGDYSTFRL